MTEYAMTLIGVCILSVAVGVLLAESGYEKCANAAMGIILLYAILSPIPALLGDIAYLKDSSTLPEYDDAFTDAIEGGAAEGIRLAVCEEFGLDPGNVEVDAVKMQGDSISFERISITLKGAAVISDYRKIREFVEDMALGRCEVRLDYE